METDLVFWANAQPVMGFAIALFMVIVFFASGMSNRPAPSIKIPERIDTGIRLSDNHDYSLEISQLKREINALKTKERPQVVKQPTVAKLKESDNTGLIQDCIDTLIGLGEKKSVARSTVNKYFVNNPNTKTVDEFIAGVFKR